jgi:hypothetical protein
MEENLFISQHIRESPQAVKDREELAALSQRGNLDCSLLQQRYGEYLFLFVYGHKLFESGHELFSIQKKSQEKKLAHFVQI